MKNEEKSVDAQVSATRKISTIWFVPFVAAIIGLWMLYYQWSTQGHEISLKFATAESMQIGKTKIKYRSINIGEVTGISFDEYSTGIIVTANIDRENLALLREDTQFWLVSPKVSIKEITGLSTLISGVYIELSPGSAQKKQKHFTALSQAPVTPLGTPGLHITLNSDGQFSYQVGDPIIYKGLSVGKIEDVYFNFEERTVYYNAFINAPYHQLITTNTKFWDISGFRVRADSHGVSLDIGSVDSLLTNGVTFGLLEGYPSGELITQRAYFDIYDNHQHANENRHKNSCKLILLVDGSVRGLHVGASVEYKGIKVGQVESINVVKPPTAQVVSKHSYQVPVLISIQPASFGFTDDDVGINNMENQIKQWSQQGFSAQLQAGSLLTGSLYINLAHTGEPVTGKLPSYLGYNIISSEADSFSQLTAKANVFIDSLNNMPLTSLSHNANELMSAFTNTAKALQVTSQSLNGVLDSAQKQELVKKLTQTIEDFSQLSKDFSADSTFQQEAMTSLQAIQKLLYELTPLINQLNKQPNSLIFNGGADERIIPKKHPEVN